MKRLLIATDCFLPRWDGIARFLSEIIPKIKHDFKITVIAPDFKGNYLNKDEIDIIRIPIYKFQLGDFQPAKFKSKIIRKEVEKADIIWSQTIGSVGSLAIKHGKRLKKPVFAFVHSIEWELVSSSLTKNNALKKIVYFLTESFAIRTYKKCSLLMVPSKETAKQLKDINTPKTIIYLGTNTERFFPSKNKEESKRIINIDHENHVIGFCGRIGREKDLDTLYRTFLRLEEKYNNIKLLIVGKGLKSEEEYLRQKKNVIITGAVNNVVPYLQAMDIYVLPSLTETSSLSTMEAMSCGLPIVTTKVGYVQKYIKEKENGLFFPKQNDYVLSLKLKWLIENKIFRKMLGENARKTAVNRFSWDKTAAKIKIALGKKSFQ